MPGILVSKQDVLELIRQRVKAAGGQAAFARAAGISPQMLNDTLRGRLELGATIGASVRAVPVEMWSLPDPAAPAIAGTNSAPPAAAPVPRAEPAELVEPGPGPEPMPVAAAPAPETCGACANFHDGMCHARDLETTAETPWCPLFELPA